MDYLEPDKDPYPNPEKKNRSGSATLSDLEEKFIPSPKLAACWRAEGRGAVVLRRRMAAPLLAQNLREKRREIAATSGNRLP